MELLIMTLSIIGITGGMALLNKRLSFRICPLCAGVSVTWLWMLIALSYGYLSINPIVPAMLLGGSVIGIMTQLEKHKIFPSRALLFWKTLFVILGFCLAFSLVLSQWTLFVILLICMFLFGLVLYGMNRARKLSSMSVLTEIGGEVKEVRELEKNMEECC